MAIVEFTTIFSAAKAALEIAKKSDNIELTQKILDLQEKAIELLGENDSLRKENENLKNDKKFREALEFKNNSYWEKINGNGPYCSGCLDAKNVPIRLHQTNDPAFSKCPTCNTLVKSYPEKEVVYVQPPSTKRHWTGYEF